MSGNIKYFYIGNLSNKKTILEQNYQNITQAEQDTKQIFERLCSMRDKKFEERSKVPNKNGNYFFTCHLPNKFYMVLADPTYKESLVFDLITEVHNSSINDSLDDNGQVQQEGKQYLKILIDKFDNQKSKISDINNDIDDIKIEMKGNVRNLIQSKEKADELQQRSEQIKDGADLFAKNANEVKKIECWKNWKLIIIIALIVIGILLVIIITIVVTIKNSDSSSNTNTNSTTNEKRILFLNDISN